MNLTLSVDDRRALWALTERHLRSPAFPAVLLVRDALRRGARTIHVRTSGDRLQVEDDGADLDDMLPVLAGLVTHPSTSALHQLEARSGTDLLVAIVTATASEIGGRHRRLRLRRGHVESLVDDAPASRRNRVALERPRRLREAERAELRAWLPSPRAAVLVDGHGIGAAPTLPDDAFSPRIIRTTGGQGQVALSLDSVVSRFTVLARGVWVTQEQLRPHGLPVVGVWDDDRLPPHPGDVVAAARAVFERASEELLDRLASEWPTMGGGPRSRLRRALARGTRLPTSWLDVSLFDGPRGPFSVSLGELRTRQRVVVGRGVGDVFIDDDAAPLLHRELRWTENGPGPPGPLAILALPPPRRRWRALLGLSGSPESPPGHS